MNDTYRVRTLGGTLVVTIPQKLARDLTLRAGDEVKIRATSNDAIRIDITRRNGMKGKSK